MSESKREQGKLKRLFEELKAGDISRREFIQRAAALGVSMSVIGYLLKAPSVSGAPSGGSSGIRAVSQAAATAPDAGMEGRTRGEGGELRVLLWQAVTTISPHTSTGTKDYLAAQFVLEPLMSYQVDGSLVPVLITEVPSIENGLLAEDGSSVTYTLKEGIVWNDGEPLTAEDVRFTWQWIMDPDNRSVSTAVYEVIEDVEVVDDLTATVHFTNPNPTGWYIPHSGFAYGPTYPAHILSEPGSHDQFRQDPVGTGPYRVESFAENDQVIFTINDNYREPNKPFFSTVNVKGGGDAVSAARAVLQTGEFDYAWNLQVEPDILAQLQEGGAGTLWAAVGTNLERIHFNFSNPWEEYEGERGHWQNPHPFLTDPAVRQAMAMAADRELIATQFYEGADGGEPPAGNVLLGIPAMESPNTSWVFDVEAAAQVLEDAGWVMEGDVRVKDGVELSVTYSTSINAARQKTQQVIKAAFEELGIRVRLTQVDAGIYFDSAPGNEQNIGHFYADLQMYTSGADNPYPLGFMDNWYSGGGSNIAQEANNWGRNNFQRYDNPEYDALFEQARTEIDYERGAELFIQMNDILIDDNVVVPLVQRAADKYAISNRLRGENVALGPFEGNFWNIANWNTVDDE